MKSQIVVLAVAIAVLLVTGAAMADTFGTGVSQFTIDFVPISGATNPTSGYGIVNHDYRMGAYEITNDQWDKFEAAYGPVRDCQSAYTGTNVPVDRVTWFEAAQFVNYLNTSTGNQAAYKFTGSTFTPWSATDAGYDASNPYRNTVAKYFLPTEDEWVKAAYWNSTTLQLQQWATKDGNTPTQAGWNFNANFTYATNPPGPWIVGSGSQELNGTYDMMGNDWEWMESPWTSGDYGVSSARGWRGSDWHNGAYSFAASYRDNWGYPWGETDSSGFRVASVPEPGSISLVIAGWLCLFAYAWQKGRQTA